MLVTSHILYTVVGDSCTELLTEIETEVPENCKSRDGFDTTPDSIRSDSTSDRLEAAGEHSSIKDATLYNFIPRLFLASELINFDFSEPTSG